MGHESFTEKFHISYLLKDIYSYLQLFIDIYLLIFSYNYLLKITCLFAIIDSQLSTYFFILFFIGKTIYLQITKRSHVIHAIPHLKIAIKEIITNKNLFLP